MDEIVVFSALTQRDLAQIAEQMLGELEQRAQKSGYKLHHSPELPVALAGKKRPAYGARELRRQVSRAVEQALADSIASGTAHPGQSFTACVRDGQVVLQSGDTADRPTATV